MSDQRSLMMKALRERLVPELRRLGFKGSFPHFHRPLTTRVDFLTIQFNSAGGSFPDSERVVGSRIDGRRAIVDTDREAPLGGGRLRYTLHRRGDSWLIYNVERLVGDTWQRGTL